MAGLRFTAGPGDAFGRARGLPKSAVALLGAAALVVAAAVVVFANIQTGDAIGSNAAPGSAADAAADHADAMAMTGHAGHEGADMSAPAGSTYSVGEDGDLTAVNAELREQWGIEIQAVRLTAASTMLDYRYHVIDAEAAAALHGIHVTPRLHHHASGLTLGVPFANKIGSLRQSSHAPIEGRTYAILFANPGRLAHAGDVVDLEIGDKFRVNGVRIQ